MPRFDLTIIISVIVAMCAILSPIITSIINNVHHTKIRKLELNYQLYEVHALHIREIFENYLTSLGKCINYINAADAKEYNTYYSLALVYSPESLKKKMYEIHKQVHDETLANNVKLVSEVTSEIHNLLEKLSSNSIQNIHKSYKQ